MGYEVRTSGSDKTLPKRNQTPHITYGEWSATPELRWALPHPCTLMQKMRRRVKRDWGGGCIARSYEYEWFPVPTEERA